MSCSQRTGLNTKRQTRVLGDLSSTVGPTVESLWAFRGVVGVGVGGGRGPKQRNLSPFNLDILYSRMALWDSNYALSHLSLSKEPKLKSHSPLFLPKLSLLLRTMGKRSLSRSGREPHRAGLMWNTQTSHQSQRRELE